MKERITHNLGLKIFSLFLAVAIWLIIINMADPVTKAQFRGVEVDVINDALPNYVYEVVEGKTVDVTLVGKRSVVSTIQRTDLYAFADLSKLSIVKAAAIEVEIRRYLPNQPDKILSPQMLKVSLEEVETKTVNVRVEAKGSVDEEHYLGDVSAKPNLVQVRGGVSVVERISYVKVEVDVEGRSRDFKEKVEPKAYDANDRLVESNNLTFLVDEEPIDAVTVNVKILNKKAVDVVPIITGTPANGYVNVQAEAVPEQIVIAGTPKALEQVDKLEWEVDVEQRSETFDVNVSGEKLLERLREYNVRLVEPEELVIRVLVEPLITQTYDFTSKSIEVRNKPEGWQAFFAEEEAQFTIDLRGIKSLLGGMKSNLIKCYVDVNGLTQGRHTLKLQYELPEGVERVSEDYNVELELLPGP